MVDWRQTDRAEVRVQVKTIKGVGRDNQTQVDAVVEGVSARNLPINLYLPTGIQPVIDNTVWAVIQKGQYNPKKLVNNEIPPGAPTWDWFYDVVVWDSPPPDGTDRGTVAPSQSPAQQQKSVSGGRAPLAPIGDAREAGIRAAVAYGKAVEVFRIFAANDGDFLARFPDERAIQEWLKTEALVIYTTLTHLPAMFEEVDQQMQQQAEPDAFDALGEQPLPSRTPAVPAAPQDPPAQTDLGW
jgi:hypothetical protein